MRWQTLFRRLRLLILGGVFLLLLAPQWPVFGESNYQMQTIVQQREFDFLVWVLGAASQKAESVISGSQQLLSPEDQSRLVIDHLRLLGEAQQLAAELDALYVDPESTASEATVTELQQAYTAARAKLAQRQPLAEAIVQDQVSTVLVEQGFGVAGRTWPPVLMNMTPLPTILIVSPRDRIERADAVPLVHGLTTPTMDEMETAVLHTLDQSALVVPIGGLGTFPAMIQETTNINWLVEVTAHEWSHHWMSFYPIGWNYFTDDQVRIINETVASIIDREIATIVIERYYPDFVPPPAPAPIPPLSPIPEAPVPPPFDFRAEMAETRIEVDRLLAAGEIEAAELYMEARRQIFVENGYPIRKLNQAYFAFYGAYAAVPGGAAGIDPIGPMVREIRRLSPSLYAFMTTMAQVGSFEQMQVALGRLQAEAAVD